jgi:hypothetical protein
MKIIKITHKDLIGKVKLRKMAGFQGLNTGRSGCTAPWARLQKVCDESIKRKGLATAHSKKPDEKPVKYFTGEFQWLVRQGGISADNFPVRPVEQVDGENESEDFIPPSYFQKIFREDVYPAIKNFVPDCGDVFLLTMRYEKDLLMEIEMKYKGK